MLLRRNLVVGLSKVEDGPGRGSNLRIISNFARSPKPDELTRVRES